MKNWLRIIVFFLVSFLLISACSKTDDKSETASEEDQPKAEPVDNKYNFFETVLVKPGTKTEEITVYGKVKSVNNYSLVPAVQGQVTKLFVTNGSPVKAGQLIAYIDNKVLQTETAQLTADYQVALSEAGRAKLQYGSAKKLFDLGIMPRQDYDNAFYNYQQSRVKAEAAKAKIAALNTQLSYGRVIAENSGYIFNLLPVGSMVGPGLTPLASISAAASDIEFNLPFNLKLYPGETIYIDDKAYPVNSIYADPASNNRVAAVKISSPDFENAQPVNAVYKKITHGMQVPQASVISYEGNPVVFTVLKEKEACSVRAAPVKIIFSDDKNYLVSGIKAKTRIIAKGAEILEDEEKIECEK
jgi:RND family efflux transporter MFP subunit